MKHSVVGMLLPLSLAFLLVGCAWEVGGGDKHVTMQPSIGQQLIDLQKARDSGAMTESEYQAQKAKVLGNR